MRMRKATKKMAFRVRCAVGPTDSTLLGVSTRNSRAIDDSDDQEKRRAVGAQLDARHRDVADSLALRRQSLSVCRACAVRVHLYHMTMHLPA